MIFYVVLLNFGILRKLVRYELQFVLLLILNNLLDITMDVRDMSAFETDSFDAIIDKGTYFVNLKGLLNYAHFFFSLMWLCGTLQEHSILFW